MVNDSIDFVPVKLATSLVEPDGFYSKYNQISPAHRKLVLLRMPLHFPLSSLQGSVLRGTGRKQPFCTIKDEAGSFRVKCSTEKPAAAVAVPGIKGLSLELFEELWTVERMDEEVVQPQGSPLDFDRDVGGGVKGRKRSQPEDLKMNLSAIDFSSVINRAKRRLHTDSSDGRGSEKSSKTTKADK